MIIRPSGPRRTPGRWPGRAGALVATLPPTRRSLKQILARIASGYYDRDDVCDQVLRCIRVEIAGTWTGGHRD